MQERCETKSDNISQHIVNTSSKLPFPLVKIFTNPHLSIVQYRYFAQIQNYQLEVTVFICTLLKRSGRENKQRKWNEPNIYLFSRCALWINKHVAAESMYNRGRTTSSSLRLHNIILHCISPRRVYFPSFVPLNSKRRGSEKFQLQRAFQFKQRETDICSS